MRLTKPRPLLPMVQYSASTPFASHSLCWFSTRRSRLVLRPPHRPLSVVMTTAPTRRTSARRVSSGWRYSALARAACIVMLRMRCAYGRPCRIRSCAFFIFDAATISIALVILRVLCTLLILPRISFELAMASRSERPGLLEVLDRRRERLLVVGGHVLRRLDLLVQLRVLAPHERAERRLERERLL